MPASVLGMINLTSLDDEDNGGGVDERVRRLLIYRCGHPVLPAAYGSRDSVAQLASQLRLQDRPAGAFLAELDEVAKNFVAKLKTLILA